MRLLFGLLALWLSVAAPALAQGTDISFGAAPADRNAPVEISADSLEMAQSQGRAVFAGSVTVSQGEMRLSADQVEVAYGTEDGKITGTIDAITATGNVVLVSGGEAAEGQRAVYSPETATLEMTGDVLITQGPSAISGQRLVVDLDSGTGRMEGRVTTVLRPAKE